MRIACNRSGVVKRIVLGLVCTAVIVGVVLFFVGQGIVRKFTLDVGAQVPSGQEMVAWAPVELADSLTGQKSIEYAVTMTTLEGPKGFAGVMRIRCRARSRDVLAIFNHIFSFNKYPSWTMARNGQIIRVGFISARANADGKAIFLRGRD
jgi:hypothetical protein